MKDPHLLHRVMAAALTVALLGIPAVARADDDELASIYTEGGFELRRDDRIFALYIALIAGGFERGEQARTLPFPRYVLHPIHDALRQKLLERSDKLKPLADKFLDAHPETVEAYLGAALTLADGTGKATTDTPANLAGLDKFLADFGTAAKLPKLSKGVAAEYRELMKKLRGMVDAPFAQVRSAYHLNEEDAPNLVLIPTPLDMASVAVAKHPAGGSHYVLFGVPSGDQPVDLKPALRAYSALLAKEIAATTTMKGLAEAADLLHNNGTLASDIDGEGIIRESLRAAVEAKLWSEDATVAADASMKKGFILTREFVMAFEEPADTFPPDKGSFVSQVVARVDIKKTLTEFKKPSTIRQ